MLELPLNIKSQIMKSNIPIRYQKKTCYYDIYFASGSGSEVDKITDQ